MVNNFLRTVIIHDKAEVVVKPPVITAAFANDDQELQVDDQELKEDNQFDMDIIDEITDRTSSPSCEEYLEDDIVYDNKTYKEFNCSQCDSSFTQKHSLKTHMLIHTGDMPFSCKHCNRKFRLKTALVTHERLHTDEKPFSCSECNERFRYKYLLKVRFFG